VLEVFGKSLLASVILCRPQRCAAAREDVIAGIASGESPIANRKRISTSNMGFGNDIAPDEFSKLVRLISFPCEE